MPDMSRVEMGACSIKLGDDDIGSTLGPTVVQIQPIWRPRRDEKYGESIVEHIWLGSRVTLVARVQEKTLANLKRALPYALEGEGYVAEGRTPGLRMSSASATITLHPLEATGTEKDIIIHRAAAQGVFEMEFQEGKERSFLVTFAGLIDPSQLDGALHARINQP